MTDKNTPKATYRAGAIKATVWSNPSNDPKMPPMVSVKISRSYKDKEGKWQETASFNVADLPKAVLVLSQAYENEVLKETSE